MEIMEGVRPGRDDGRDVAILMATSIVIMIYHDAVGGDGVLSGFAAVAAVHSDRGAAVREAAPGERAAGPGLLRG
jgi:hypothetical protein